MKNGSRYRHQSWVFEVHGLPALVMQGHVRQFTVLDQANKKLLLKISINENYAGDNLFVNIHKFAKRLQ